MHKLLVFLKRDCRLMSQSSHVVFLPLCYFLVSLFLIRLMMPSISGHILQLFWVLLVLSTLGTLGQTVAKDKEKGFLKAFQKDQSLLLRYILSKGICLSLFWILPYWGLYNGLAWGMGHEVPVGRSFIIFGCFLTPLAFLYILFDTLVEGARTSALLSLILFAPFMIPLLIFASLSLSGEEGNTLPALLSYGTFLSLVAGFLAAHSLRA